GDVRSHRRARQGPPGDPGLPHDDRGGDRQPAAVADLRAAVPVQPPAVDPRRPGRLPAARRRGAPGDPRRHPRRRRSPRGRRYPGPPGIPEGPVRRQPGPALTRRGRRAFAPGGPVLLAGDYAFFNTKSVVVVPPLVIFTFFTCGWKPSLAQITCNGLFRTSSQSW